MGISSVIKLVNSDGGIVHEEDFDKTLDRGLSDIARSLGGQHAFAKLMDLLSDGSPDDELRERFDSILGEEAEEMGSAVISYEDLREFESYLGGDIETQWKDLLPGRQPGFANWIRCRLWGRPIEMTYKDESSEGFEYRDDYALLLELLRRALRERLFVIRELY